MFDIPGVDYKELQISLNGVMDWTGLVQGVPRI